MCLRMQVFCNACDLFISWPLYEAGTHGKACLKDYISGTSLVVQWLRLTSNAGAQVQSLVRELRPHMPCTLQNDYII